MKWKQKGFSIVELIIVIVVIAVLASITVVAYTGIQRDARNAARISAVTSAIEMVEVALTKHSPSEIRATLNVSDTWWRACIGTGYPGGVCGTYSAPYVTESANFNTLMQTSVGTMWATGYPETKSTDGDIVRGPYLTSAWVDSKNMLGIEYTLEGEGLKCVGTPLMYRLSGSNTLTPPAGDAANYSKSQYGVTECVVAVVTNYY